MIEKLVISIAVIFVFTWLWVKFQDAGRKFAKKHPEFGRYREEGGECGKTCGCANWKHCMLKSEAGKQKHRIDPADLQDQTDPSDQPNI
ncbi:hypothetical protein P0Y35_02640 [Kiritimatiellaeota bacterium B1221]|nr:hypothetical protein [Kiritimatiellaeota bacterium B1221]